MVDDGATGSTLVNPNWTTAALRGCKWLFFGTLIILICMMIVFTGKVATLGHRASINARADELVTKSNEGSREAFEELRKLAESHSRFECLTALASMRKIKGFNSERMQVALQVLSQDDSVGWHEGLLLLSEMPELSAECAPALLRALRKHTFGVFHETALQSLARIDGAVCEFKLELLEIASQRNDRELTDMISTTITRAKCP